MLVVKVRDHVVSIDSDHPDKPAPLQIEGDNPDEIRRWISGMCGFRGIGLDGESEAPSDLIAGLCVEKADFEILEGEEILDIPTEELPAGAVW
jgi:hypothetical protein